MDWYIFLYLAAIGGICNGVFSYMITSYLSKRGIKINYWNMRPVVPIVASWTSGYH